MAGFASVRRRGTELRVDGGPPVVYVASLQDIIASKRKLGRPKDLAVLPVLELTLDEQQKNAARKVNGSPWPPAASPFPSWKRKKPTNADGSVRC